MGWLTALGHSSQEGTNKDLELSYKDRWDLEKGPAARAGIKLECKNNPPGKLQESMNSVVHAIRPEEIWKVCVRGQAGIPPRR